MSHLFSRRSALAGATAALFGAWKSIFGRDVEPGADSRGDSGAAAAAFSSGPATGSPAYHRGAGAHTKTTVYDSLGRVVQTTEEWHPVHGAKEGKPYRAAR
jgi:hypothetical protein